MSSSWKDLRIEPYAGRGQHCVIAMSTNSAIKGRRVLRDCQTREEAAMFVESYNTEALRWAGVEAMLEKQARVARIRKHLGE